MNLCRSIIFIIFLLFYNYNFFNIKAKKFHEKQVKDLSIKMCAFIAYNSRVSQLQSFDEWKKN